MYAPLEATDKEAGYTSGSELSNRVGTWTRPRTELNDVETDTSGRPVSPVTQQASHLAVTVCRSLDSPTRCKSQDTRD